MIMGVFKTIRTLQASPALIPGVANEIAATFLSEGYQVQTDELASGGADISISKGSTFKAVLGMKSALKINLQPSGSSIAIEAGVGIFGQQAIPTAISMLFLWPVLLTQIWGMVQQSQLDERAIGIAEAYVRRQSSARQPGSPAGGVEKFCTACGRSQPAEARFCGNCGAKLD